MIFLMCFIVYFLSLQSLFRAFKSFRFPYFLPSLKGDDVCHFFFSSKCMAAVFLPLSAAVGAAFDLLSAPRSRSGSSDISYIEMCNALAGVLPCLLFTLLR